MERTELKALYEKYDLKPSDVYKHKHYVIITRSGVERIAIKADIAVTYDVIKCEKDFCVVKAIAVFNNMKLETFGSALHGDFKSGNTNSWYVMEMAEKRALSRAVLKATGFYQLGVFGEDESEDFKRK